VHRIDEGLPLLGFETVHNIEITVVCQVQGDFFIDDRLHIRGYNRQTEAAASENHRCVALASAADDTFGGNQLNILVVKNILHFSTSKSDLSRIACPIWNLL
jgi:hypothetical protein